MEKSGSSFEQRCLPRMSEDLVTGHRGRSKTPLGGEGIMLRLLVGFGLLIALLIAVGQLGLRRMDEINASLDDILEQRWAKLQLSRQALEYSTRNSRVTTQIFLTRDKTEVRGLLALRADNSKVISDLVEELTRRCDSADERRLLFSIQASRERYVGGYLRALRLLVDENNPEAGASLMSREVTPALIQYHAAWDELMRFEMEQVEVQGRKSRLDYTRARSLSQLTIGAAVVLAIGIALLVGSKITREMRTRMRAEQEILALNSQLEERVRARTLDLANANQQLRNEVHERQEAEKQVQFLAYYDALTGLPNRALLRDRMTVAMAGARRRREKIAVLFLDLDNFKMVNDSLGHPVGDLLLKEVASRLRAQVREQDTVARLGGDEFVIVLTTVGRDADSAITAERIVSEMARTFSIQGHELDVTCSLGISLFPDHAADIDALLQSADVAMYSAKQSGRNCFHYFTPEMNAQATQRLTLENGLRHALERNELFLMYQPQVDMQTGNIIGSEALLRWQHPELGLVPPDKFIPLAESSGAIIAIGEWVLKQACAQAQQWLSQGLPPVPVSVNVSPVQFRQRGFAQFVKNTLQETALAPHLLELELTEGLILSSAEVARTVLQDLREMGIRLSIDDFGTGYSNLSYLRQFPVYKLKIDRSFVQDLATNSDDAAITGTIISMARSLNLKVIAEGVETEEQMSFLRTHHCDEFQGYYFSKPLMANDFAENLRRESARSTDAPPTTQEQSVSSDSKAMTLQRGQSA
jgi:diguanylate cyclase (GGDEF)-like protein